MVANGKPTKKRKSPADLIGPPKTGGYRPTVPVMPAWYDEGIGQFQVGVVEQMRRDYQVKLGLRYKKTPIHNAKFKVQGESQEVKSYVAKQLERFWRKSLSVALLSYDYGHIGSESCYKEENGVIHFDCLKPLHPYDVKPYTSEGRLIYLRVSGVRNRSPVELDAALGGMPAKGFWLTHDATYSQFYGRPVLLAAWEPWRIKTMPDGANRVLFLWFYRHAFTGFVIRHPDVVYQDAEGEEPEPAGDLAREMAEQAKTGANFAMSSARDDSGNPIWDITSYGGKTEGQPQHLIEYVEFLNKQIIRAMEIPDEILTHDGNTGGYSRSQVSVAAFFRAAEESIGHILESFDDQVIKGLVRLRFGTDAGYEITPEPLLLDDLQQGQPQPQQPPQLPGGGGQDQQDEYGGDVFGGQQGAMQMSAHAPVGGVSVSGRTFRGGEFIPDEVLGQASSEERQKIEGGASGHHESLQRHAGQWAEQYSRRIRGLQRQVRDKQLNSQQATEQAEQHSQKFRDAVHNAVARRHGSIRKAVFAKYGDTPQSHQVMDTIRRYAHDALDEFHDAARRVATHPTAQPDRGERDSDHDEIRAAVDKLAREMKLDTEFIPQNMQVAKNAHELHNEILPLGKKLHGKKPEQLTPQQQERVKALQAPDRLWKLGHDPQSGTWHAYTDVSRDKTGEVTQLKPDGSGQRVNLPHMVKKRMSSGWQRYDGPHGGHGWKRDDEVRYQPERPDDSEGRSAESSAWQTILSVADKATGRVASKAKALVRDKIGPALRKRYGDRGYGIIAGAVKYISWLPIPGTVLAPAVAVALAELGHQVGKLFRQPAVQMSGAEVGLGDLVKGLRAVLKKVFAEAGQELPEIADEDLRSAIEQAGQGVRMSVTDDDVDAYFEFRDAIRERVRMSKAFDESEHPRGQPENPGEFASKGGGSRGGKQSDPTAGRPSKTSERHDVRPPVKPMRIPPPPQGSGSGKAGGYSANGKTNTEIGDAVEAVLTKLGMRSILPPGKRQNPLDLEFDHSGYGFEVKAVTTAAKEYKAKPKAHEMEEKRAYAKKHGMKPATMIAVLDTEKGEVHAYWREGIGAFRLTQTGDNWNYMGTVKYRG